MEDTRAKVVDLDLNDILPNRFQPRIKFSEDAIIELSESIKEHGVIQPIIVRPIGDKYEIIAGERRYKASVLAGKDTIPAIISSLNDKDCAEVALIENVQRKDLTAIEEAVSYKKILDMGYLTQEQLAVKLGKSQSAIANKIRLLNLSDEVQEALMEEKISERHARSLLKIQSAEKQKEMLERIINERLTVRKTEEEIEKMNNFINEPNSMASMNSNPSGFSTVNSGFSEIPTENKVSEGTSNPSVDFSALLMNESAKEPSSPASSMGTPMNNASQSGYQFDANGRVVGEPAPMPSMGTPMNTAPQNGYQFDANGRVIGEPTPSTVMSEMPQTPIIENPTIATDSMMVSESSSSFGLNIPPSLEPVQPAQAEEKAFSFNDLLATNSQREAQNMASYFEPVQPTTPSTQPSIMDSTMPQTPILNTQLPGAFLEKNDDIDEGNNGGINLSLAEGPKDVATGDSLKEEKVDIQPIIITDYSKQYDPVLPQSQQPVERIDFKQIISLIRDVNDTIEKCGYTIETEEVDLEDEYQVVFKINKN